MTGGGAGIGGRPACVTGLVGVLGVWWGNGGFRFLAPLGMTVEGWAPAFAGDSGGRGNDQLRFDTIEVAMTHCSELISALTFRRAR